MHMTKVSAVLTCTVGQPLSCRWFVLKQGKIYWFKSDVVTPVSHKCCAVFNTHAAALQPIASLGHHRSSCKFMCSAPASVMTCGARWCCCLRVLVLVGLHFSGRH
jgi:hypothetical protein